jgi:hypothetical protein
MSLCFLLSLLLDVHADNIDIQKDYTYGSWTYINLDILKDKTAG